MIKDWFYVDVNVIRHGSNSIVNRIKRVPRVRFHYGYDHSYMDMKTIGVYWSPYTLCSEGEEMYGHYIKFNWRPMFHFNWR